MYNLSYSPVLAEANVNGCLYWLRITNEGKFVICSDLLNSLNSFPSTINALFNLTDEDLVYLKLKYQPHG